MVLKAFSVLFFIYIKNMSNCIVCIWMMIRTSQPPLLSPPALPLYSICCHVRRTVGQIRQKCKETSFWCDNTSNFWAKLFRIRYVKIIIQALQHDSLIWSWNPWFGSLFCKKLCIYIATFALSITFTYLYYKVRCVFVCLWTLQC